MPAVSAARDQLGISNAIKIVGISVPESSRKDMEQNRISSLVLWQPFDLAYLTLYVTEDVLHGKLPAGAAYKSPLSGTLQIVSFMDGKTVVKYPAAGHKIMPNNVIILGDPMVVNLRNIDWFRGYPELEHGMKFFLAK